MNMYPNIYIRGMQRDPRKPACKKCGYSGHLTYQCRNFVKIDPNKEIVLDISSTSSESEDDGVTPLKALQTKELKEKLEKEQSKSNSKKKSKKRQRSESSESRSSSSDKIRKREGERRKKKKKKHKKTKKRRRKSSSSSEE